MEIGSLTGAQPKPSDSRIRLADNFDHFLVLLTTQLQNQDPLAPLDSTQFVQQLVSFAGVEQAISTNDTLEKLLGAFSQRQVSEAVGFIGKNVLAESKKVELGQDGATFEYALDAKATQSTVTITNDAGRVVFIGAGQTAIGRHQFAWDGLDLQNVPQPEGLYTVAVNAVDAAGKPLSVKTFTVGRVSGVENGEDGLLLEVNGDRITLDQVIAVREATGV